MKLPEPNQLPDGRWTLRYSAPPGPDGKRRQPRVYGATRKECLGNYFEAMGGIAAGRQVDDKRTKFGEHLDRRLRWWESDGDIKPSTLSSYQEACELYLKPGLGHIRLTDLRDHHFRDLGTAMRKINTPAGAQDRTDLMRRLVAARAARDGKRISTRPLTAARVRRILAVASTALSNLVPGTLAANPAAKIKVGKQRKRRPVLWTVARVERWQETGEVPAQRRMMVWTREHCGAFLDSIEDERLYSLFHVVAYYGLRRSELYGLTWAEVDLTTRHIHISHAQVEDELDSTKSEDSERIIKVDPDTADVLRAWRKVQLAERLAWGEEWTDSGRVWTRQDGTPLRKGWASERFKVLHERAGLPPVTLHGLRHTAATMLLAAGATPKVISDILGHATVAFTMDIYAEVAEELGEAAAAAVAAYIPRKNKPTGECAKAVPIGGRGDR